MKIAIFSDSFFPQVDGVASVVFRSAQGLGELGHDVYVFTASAGRLVKQEESRKEKAQKFTLIRMPSVPALIYPGYRFALPIGFAVNKLRKIKPDIIHTHTPFSVGWEAVWPAKIFGIPIVGTHHTFYNHYLKHAKIDYAWAKKISWKYTVGYYNRCNLVLSPSKSLADELKFQGLKKLVKAFPNPVDTEFFHPVASRTKKEELKKLLGIKGASLVYMGRVSYEKSIDQVIKAAALAMKKIPNLQFAIVGDGPERKKLEKLVKDLEIEKNVLFLGIKHEKDLVEALQANDVFLTASKTENMPVSILEAMATGLPVIGVDALGIPEIVLNNVNGFIVSPDKIESMAGKILQLIEDVKLRERFSKKSRELSLDYSQGEIAKKLENEYNQLILK